ncbi:MAG: 30S ribosomal protein S13 [Candidatus Aenigmarchaeota archaeon]|nr:30S ribosomal protein S13 [Candidatus Aenigmarchaeota archaeon]
MGSTKIKAKDSAKEKGKEIKEEKKEDKKRPEARDIPQFIIRVAGTDLDGGKPVVRALRKIRGIGVAASMAICLASKLAPNRKLGDLTESEIGTLESAIKNPINFGIPPFLVNRRKDRETGLDMHLTSSDLDIAKKFDIQRYINLKTYKGWRHMLGQPVRGQRTRSTFRVTGRTVGVLKKVALQKQAPATATPAPPPAQTKK